MMINLTISNAEFQTAAEVAGFDTQGKYLDEFSNIPTLETIQDVGGIVENIMRPRMARRKSIGVEKDDCDDWAWKAVDKMRDANSFSDSQNGIHFYLLVVTDLEHAVCLAAIPDATIERGWRVAALEPQDRLREILLTPEQKKGAWWVG